MSNGRRRIRFHKHVTPGALQPDTRIPTPILTLAKDASDALRVLLNFEIPAAGGYTGAAAEQTAVLTWLKYLGALTWTVSDAVICLASFRLGGTGELLQRQVFEYAVKARYYIEHPGEALDQMHRAVHQLPEYLAQLGYTPSDMVEALANRDAIIAQGIPEPKAEKKTDQMLRDLVEDSDQIYTTRFRVPSKILHATALGMSQFYVVTDGGLVPRTDLPADELVDLVATQITHTLDFGHLVCYAVPSTDESTINRLDERSSRVFQKLGIQIEVFAPVS